MTEFEACKMIEAFRSGVPSKDIGYNFSSARRELLSKISSDIEVVTETGIGGGCVFGGRYGEGKTHMLNTLKNIAEKENMAYSFISLGKESPLNNYALIFGKLVENLFLPSIGNPGFFREIENKITLTNNRGTEALDFAKNSLSTDRLYYVFKALLGTKDPDDNFILQSDLGGSLANVSTIKSIYSSVFNEKVFFREKFAKTKNMGDYFAFTSFLLKLLGYKGWLILFDEAELIGRQSNKTRMKSYLSMSKFLFPDSVCGSVYSIFAFSSSYIDEVINAKEDKNYVNLSDFDSNDKTKLISVIDSISSMYELQPLSDAELSDLLESIISLHEKAYSWHFNGNKCDLIKVAKQSGFLLRTKIRSALEYLDQYFLYGNTDEINVDSLDLDSYDEDVSLDGLFNEIDT